MKKNAKIYIAGHNGMFDSAIWRTLSNKVFANLISAYIESKTKSDWKLQYDLVTFVKLMVEIDLK